jgi:hypothetical protein
MGMLPAAAQTAIVDLRSLQGSRGGPLGGISGQH